MLDVAPTLKGMCPHGQTPMRETHSHIGMSFDCKLCSSGGIRYPQRCWPSLVGSHSPKDILKALDLVAIGRNGCDVIGMSVDNGEHGADTPQRQPAIAHLPLEVETPA